MKFFLMRPIEPVNNHRANKQMRKRNGFTLIELLIVIAIIAILAGMLLPALGRTKQIAEKIYCLNNLKTIIKAVHLYAQDFNDSLPCRPPDYEAPYDQWHLILSGENWQGIKNYKYAGWGATFGKDRKGGTFYCPSSNPRYAFNNGTYGHNRYLFGDYNDGVCFSRNATTIRQPTQALVSGDAAWPDGDILHDIASFAYRHAPGTDPGDGKRSVGYGFYVVNRRANVIGVITGSTNLVYYDGHVDSKTTEQVLKVSPTETGILKMGFVDQRGATWPRKN